MRLSTSALNISGAEEQSIARRRSSSASNSCQKRAPDHFALTRSPKLKETRQLNHAAHSPPRHDRDRVRAAGHAPLAAASGRSVSPGRRASETTGRDGEPPHYPNYTLKYWEDRPESRKISEEEYVINIC